MEWCFREVADHFTYPFICCPNFNLPFTISVSVSVCLTMVTPSNVLVLPLWHFILLHHLLLSTFPSRHTGITLIMIIAVMIMITAAKLCCLTHIQLSGDYDWLKGCLQMFLPSLLYAFCVPLFYFLFVFFSLFVFCSLASDFSPLLSSPFVSFQSFSVFYHSFISAVVLLSTFPGPSQRHHLSRLPIFFESLLFAPSPQPQRNKIICFYIQEIIRAALLFHEVK